MSLSFSTSPGADVWFRQTTSELRQEPGPSLVSAPSEVPVLDPPPRRARTQSLTGQTVEDVQLIEGGVRRNSSRFGSALTVPTGESNRLSEPAGDLDAMQPDISMNHDAPIRRASTLRFDAMQASQFIIQGSMDELKSELKDLKTDLRQVLSVVRTLEAQGISAARSVLSGPVASPQAGDYRSRLRRHTHNANGGHVRGPHHSMSWGGSTASPVPGSHHDLTSGRSSASAVGTVGSGGEGEATVALGTTKHSMKKSMTLQEMGKIGEISALMPSGWPKCVALRNSLQQLPGHAEDTKELADMVRKVSIKSASSSGTELAVGVLKNLHTEASGEGMGPRHSFFKRIRQNRFTVPTMHPHSKVRLLFDFSSLSVLVYELILIPYVLSWPVADDEGYVQFSTFCTASFWLLDIVLSFFSGFYRVADGEVEQRWRVIAVRYMKSWFCVDVVAVLGDWINLIMTVVAHGQKGAAVSRVLRIAKLGRFARLLGLMRLLRFIALMNQMLEAQMSEAWRLLARICQMSFFLLWFAHITACIWNALGDIQFGDTREVWIDTPMGLEGTMYTDFDFMYQYCTAYHWAMAQITLGAHDVNPVNTPERLFTVIVNIFGLIFGGTLVSVLSASLIDFREINKATKEKIRTLRYFLHQHDVNLDVSSRVLGQVAVRIGHTEMLTMADDVEALRLLSAKLRSDLHYALFGPHLLTLPLFRTWEQMQSECVRHLCAEGMEFVPLMAEDELFHTGLQAEAAYYIISGSMAYTQERDHGDITTVAVDVPKEKWLSEAALWTEWIHVGSAIAEVPCKLLAVQPESVMVAVQKNHLIRNLTIQYGKLFHKSVKDALPFCHPNDLEVAHASFAELLVAMPTEAQQIVGLASLEFTISNKGRRRVERTVDVDMLEFSIRGGQVALCVDKENDLHQVMRRSILLIERRIDGFRFTQVGQRAPDTGEWESMCTLPWSKPQVRELPTDALRRMIKRRLPPLAGNVKISGIDTVCNAAQGQFGLKMLSFDTTFQVHAKDAVVTRLKNYIQFPDFLRDWCTDVSSATIHYCVQHLGHAQGSIAMDEAKEEVDMFAANPEIYAFPQGVFMWMPANVMAYLASPEGKKHSQTFSDSLNQLEADEILGGDVNFDDDDGARSSRDSRSSSNAGDTVAVDDVIRREPGPGAAEVMESERYSENGTMCMLAV